MKGDEFFCTRILIGDRHVWRRDLDRIEKLFEKIDRFVGIVYPPVSDCVVIDELPGGTRQFEGSILQVIVAEYATLVLNYCDFWYVADSYTVMSVNYRFLLQFRQISSF